jgi:predicted metal-binding membrane protein
MTGPCLFACVPVVTAYISGTKRRPGEIFPEIFLFLSGRLIATIFFGFLAGISARILNNFLSSGAVSLLKLLGGATIIFLGFFVFFGKAPFCRGFVRKIAPGGIFLLGFFFGLAPCPPFIALFVEITLMSKTVFDGIFYALFFGLGLFVSGLIVLSIASGVLTGVSSKILNSDKSRQVFRIICGLLVVLIGIKWLW